MAINRRPTLCENMNHRRRDAPVSHCPQCGDVVNPHVPPRPCNESKHSAARLHQSTYCVDCGQQLVFRR